MLPGWSLFLQALYMIFAPTPHVAHFVHMKTNGQTARKCADHGSREETQSDLDPLRLSSGVTFSPNSPFAQEKLCFCTWPTAEEEPLSTVPPVIPQSDLFDLFGPQAARRVSNSSEYRLFHRTPLSSKLRLLGAAGRPPAS